MERYRRGEIRYAGKLVFVHSSTVQSTYYLYREVIVMQDSWFTTIGIMERCIERCWGVARNGTGTLTGCRRVHLPVAWALSRDQVIAPPTLITPPLSSSLYSFSFSSLLFRSLLLGSIFLPTWPHKRLFKTINFLLHHK